MTEKGVCICRTTMFAEIYIEIKHLKLYGNDHFSLKFNRRFLVKPIHSNSCKFGTIWTYGAPTSVILKPKGM
jgi:hypothetical protein